MGAESAAREHLLDTSDDVNGWSQLITREVEITYPEHRFISIYAVPLLGQDSPDKEVLVILRDVTRDRQQEVDLTIIASGSEVEIALAAAQQITDKNVRVVSMPCWELFEKQNKLYRDRIIDPDCKRRLVVEAATSFGWERYAATRSFAMITLNTFGASGPYKKLAEQFGFTVENVVAKARELFTR